MRKKKQTTINASEARRISNLSKKMEDEKKRRWTSNDDRQLNRLFRSIRRSAQEGCSFIVAESITSSIRTKLETLGYEVIYCGGFRSTWVEIKWKNSLN